ncbi:MAG: hypothetical protein ACK5O4_00115 [bacterium]
MSNVELDQSKGVIITGGDAAGIGFLEVFQSVLERIPSIPYTVVDGTLGGRIEDQGASLETFIDHLSNNKDLPFVKASGRTPGNKIDVLSGLLTKFFGYPELPESIPVLVNKSPNAKIRSAGDLLLARGPNSLVTDFSGQGFPFTPQTPITIATPNQNHDAHAKTQHHLIQNDSTAVQVVFRTRSRDETVILDSNFSENSPFEIYGVDAQSVKSFIEQELKDCLQKGEVPIFAAKTTVLGNLDGVFFAQFKELMETYGPQFTQAGIPLPSPYYENGVPNQEGTIIDAVASRLEQPWNEVNLGKPVRYIMPNGKDYGVWMQESLEARKQNSVKADHGQAEVTGIRWSAGTGELYNTDKHRKAQDDGTLEIRIDGQTAQSIDLKKGDPLGVIYNKAEDIRYQARATLAYAKETSADHILFDFDANNPYYGKYIPLIKQVMSEEFPELQDKVQFVSPTQACALLNGSVTGKWIEAGPNLIVDIRTDQLPAQRGIVISYDSSGINYVGGKVCKVMDEFPTGTDIQNMDTYIQTGHLRTDITPSVRVAVGWLRSLKTEETENLADKLEEAFINITKAGIVSPLLKAKWPKDHPNYKDTKPIASDARVVAAALDAELSRLLQESRELQVQKETRLSVLSANLDLDRQRDGWLPEMALTEMNNEFPLSGELQSSLVHAIEVAYVDWQEKDGVRLNQERKSNDDHLGSLMGSIWSQMRLNITGGRSAV